ncbi:tumor necrosis factor receptor superfamily member 23 isoform X2 [Pangasianodon hypophthalmus]|uniref:tumor necrosis factor receptor superfamily member 23 isoform X2 n=1 Tax=Pangasianodon hypophthalmus TaxID=310915 RepID=UPI002307EFCB|nr:tumor necrosis factor receptor superfamily member 23 isoform X2 [Pangasianodon hypophthalmus]
MIIWRKMNIGMPLLAFAMLDFHVKSCPENEFELPDSICCSFCPEGRYVAVNCTRQGRLFTGVSCKECTKCTDGTQMIAPCTNFSDTKCSENSLTTVTMTIVTPKPEGELVITHMALYATAPVVFLLIIAAVVYKWCTRRSVSRDPAEPFKIMI